jgi:Holliday junction resolvase-like predicted endonuclease
MNYEAELDRLFVDHLMKMYGIGNEETAYKIFLIRFLIENYDLYRKPNKSNIELEVKLPRFLIAEFNLPVIRGSVYYKNEKLVTHPASKNSLANILDNWFFRYADTLTLNIRGDSVLKSSLIEDEVSKIFAQAEKTISIKKRDKRYPVHFKKACLDIVKANYQISPQPVGRISGFDYPINHNDFKPTLDEKYDRLVHADNLSLTPASGLTEHMLEEYLIKNMDIIEEGMQFISSQFAVDNGRLDILARDRNGTLCVIELKVNDDTDLIYQSVYYRLKIKEKFQVNHVRMITIAPHYPAHIKEALKALKEVEMYVFDIQLKEEKIVDLKLMKSS